MLVEKFAKFSWYHNESTFKDDKDQTEIKKEGKNN